MIYRRLFLGLGGIILLTALGLAIYAAWLRATALTLISSAKEIHSLSDADRQIEAWRRLRLASFFDGTTNFFGEHPCTVILANTVLWKLHLAPPTVVSVSIMMRHGELHNVVVLLSSGSNPIPPGVAVYEWFAPDMTNRFHVVRKYSPSRAIVDLSSTVPEPQRGKVFALNANCMVKPRGCSSAEDILPGVWQLDNAP